MVLEVIFIVSISLLLGTLASGVVRQWLCRHNYKQDGPTVTFLHQKITFYRCSKCGKVQEKREEMSANHFPFGQKSKRMKKPPQ